MDNIVLEKFVNFKVYSVTRIKRKYGFRILLYYENREKPVSKQMSGFKTQKEANNARELAVAELHNGTYVVEQNIFVKNFLTFWLEKVMRSKITDDSYVAYKNAVYNHIIPSLGAIKLISLNRGHIQRFYNKKMQISESVTALCKTVMNTALEYAKEHNLVSYNAASNIKIKNMKKKPYRTRVIDETKTLTEEQLRLLIEKSKDTPIHLQIMFAALMGLRKSEINGLKYSDVDFIHRKLKVQRQLGKLPNTDNSELKVGEYTKQEIPVKSFSSNRELDIPDILFEAILEERKKYERNRSKRINDKTSPFKDYDYIVCSTYGNPRSKSFHFKYYKDILKDCQLPDIRFHELRSTYCTLLVKHDFNVKAISQAMGHATEIISLDVYTDKTQIINDCLDVLEPFIEEVVPKVDKEKGRYVDCTETNIDSFVNELVDM